MRRVMFIKEGSIKLEEIEIGDELVNLQNSVNGIIEIPYISEKLYENKIDIVINEEGKLMDLCPTIAVIDKETNETLDLLVGNVLFTGFTEEGETVGLTDEQCNIIKESLECVLYRDNSSNEMDVMYALRI